VQLFHLSSFSYCSPSAIMTSIEGSIEEVDEADRELFG